MLAGRLAGIQLALQNAAAGKMLLEILDHICGTGLMGHIPDGEPIPTLHASPLRPSAQYLKSLIEQLLWQVLFPADQRLF